MKNNRNPQFANYLLARYEKSHAIEMSDSSNVINTPELQQYYLTIGNPAFQKQAEKMAQTELFLQKQCDLQTISSNKSEFNPNASNLVNISYDYTSEKVLFDYTNAINAQRELEQKIREAHDENNKLSMIMLQMGKQN